MANALASLKLSALPNSSEDDEQYIPLDMSDIIDICQEYNKLGWKIQKQIQYIKEFGIEKSLQNGTVKIESLLAIKDFLHKICENFWFSDAHGESNDLIFLIEDFELRHPELFMTNTN